MKMQLMRLSHAGMLCSVLMAGMLSACLGGSGSATTASSVVVAATANTTTQSLTVGTAMNSFSPLMPSGGTAPYKYSIISGTLPAGLSFNVGTGVVSGTPTATYAMANVVFSVQDANGVVAGTTSTVIFAVGAASPFITATANTTAQTLAVGSAMASFSPLMPSGGTAPYTYSYLGTLPAGLSLDTGTGAVTGTPTATNAGVDVYFLVKDGNNVMASITSTVHFTVVPAITATATTTAQKLAVGSAMASFSPLTPSNGIAPYTYSVASGVLPAGVSLDAATGAVTGTPTATYAAADVVFSVKDANNALATTTSTVNFLVNPAFIAIVDNAARNLTVGTAMTSFTPVTPSSGGIAPYTYSVVSGTLPAGLTLNASTGLVSGTPTTGYVSANVTFAARDANGIVANPTSTVSFSVPALPAGFIFQGGVFWMPISAVKYTWTNADVYCRGTIINGQTGWRLPTEVELANLYASRAMIGQGWTLGATWGPDTGMRPAFPILDLSNGATAMAGDSSPQYVTCVR